MEANIILQVFAAICAIAIIPVPVFWLSFHRNIKHFRRHPQHAVCMMAALIALVTLLVANNTTEFSVSFGTNIAGQAAGAALIVFAVYLTWKISNIMDIKTTAGLQEIKNKKIFLKRGIYHSIRHPIYLSIFLFLAGFLLATGLAAFMYLLIYTITMFTMVTIEEEKELVKRFGKEFILHKKNTGRFIPKF